MTKIISVLAVSGLLSGFLLFPSQAQAGHGHGEYCREYTRTIYIHGREKEGYGIACLQPDGSWEIQSEKLRSVKHHKKRHVHKKVTYRKPWYKRTKYYFDDHYQCPSKRRYHHSHYHGRKYYGRHNLPLVIKFD